MKVDLSYVSCVGLLHATSSIQAGGGGGVLGFGLDGGYTEWICPFPSGLLWRLSTVNNHDENTVGNDGEK